MVQSSMDMGGDELEIRAKVVLSLEQAKRQLQELGGNLSGGAANLAGQAGAAMGIGTRGANADAEPTRTKEQDERAKVRTTALQTLAKSAPGGGLMSSMASSFKGGGIMAGMATGITAVVGILTQIMKSSQVFQTMAGTIFKILGMMADLFLMPFVPLMMKFASWMIQHMPQIQEAGQKVADFTEKLVSIFTWGGRQEKEGRERQEQGGMWNKIVGGAQEGLGRGLSPGGIFRALPGGVGGASLLGKLGQFGNSEASGGPRVAMGGGGDDTTGSSIDFSGKVASWIKRFQQKEMGPGGVMERWYDEMFGGSIMPDIWGNIRGFFGGIETETGSIHKRVSSDTDELETDRKGFWDKLKFWEYIPEIWGKVKDFFSGLGTKLKDFFTFDIPLIDLGDSASTVAACFGRAKNAVVNFFTNTIPNAARSAAAGISTAASWTWGGVQTVISSVGSAFSTAGSAVWNFFTNTIPNWAGTAGRGIATAAQWVWGGATTAASWVGGHLATAGRAVWGFFSETLPGWAGTAGGAVANAAKVTWGAAVTAAKWVGGHLATAGKAIGNFFSNTLPGWAGTAKDKVVELAGSVYNSAKNIGSWTYRGLSSAGGAVGDFFTGTLPGWANTAKDKVAEFAGNVYNSAKYLYSWTYGGLKDAGGKIGGFFKDTLPGWADTASGKVAGFVRNVGGVSSWVISGISSAMSSATSAVTSFISGLGSQISSVASSVGSRLKFWEFGNTASNSMYEFGNSVTSGGIHHFGGSDGGPRRVMGVGNMLSGGGGGVTSSRVVNVNINSSMSIHDIVRDVERLDSIQEAAFFNTV